MTNFIADRTAWWNAENRLPRLARLREAGVSFSKIAAELGTTKNAAIGMASRMGLLNERGTTKNASISMAHRMGLLNECPVKPATNTVAELPPDRGSCAWPLWGDDPRPVYRYCRKHVAVTGAPYCYGHMVEGHQKVRAE